MSAKTEIEGAQRSINDAVRAIKQAGNTQEQEYYFRKALNDLDRAYRTLDDALRHVKQLMLQDR